MNRRDFLKSSVVAATAACIQSSYHSEAQDRGIVRYPDPWIEVIDSSFSKMVMFNAAVERLYTGTAHGSYPLALDTQLTCHTFLANL